MLVDPDLEVTKAWGVENGQIPHPTAAILDTDGVLRYVRVDEDYKVRPPTAAELLPVLREAD